MKNSKTLISLISAGLIGLSLANPNYAKAGDGLPNVPFYKDFGVNEALEYSKKSKEYSKPKPYSTLPIYSFDDHFEFIPTQPSVPVAPRPITPRNAPCTKGIWIDNNYSVVSPGTKNARHIHYRGIQEYALENLTENNQRILSFIDAPETGDKLVRIEDRINQYGNSSHIYVFIRIKEQKIPEPEIIPAPEPSPEYSPKPFPRATQPKKDKTC